MSTPQATSGGLLKANLRIITIHSGDMGIRVLFLWHYSAAFIGWHSGRR